MNLAQDSVHGSVDGPPLAGLQAWQRGVFVDDAWAVLHQIEGSADDPSRGTDRVFQWPMMWQALLCPVYKL